MIDLDDIQRRTREVFRQEASDLLAELEAALLDLEAAPANADAINRVFRAMHTLKGSGATSGFPELSQFLHHVEDVFNAAREGRVQVSPTIIDRTLKVSDAVTRYLADTTDRARDILTQAQPHLDVLLAHLPQKTATTNQPTTAAQEKRFRIHFRPHRQLFQTGTDPGVFLDDLRALGTANITGLTDELPDLDALDPEQCYLHWQIDLATTGSESAIREVFAFVEDDCDLDIHALDADEAPLGIASPIAAPQPPPGEWLIDFKLTPQSLAAPGLVDSLWLNLAKLGSHRVLQSPAGPTPQAGDWRISLTTALDEPTIADAFVFILDAAPVIRRTASTAASSAPPTPPRPATTGAPAHNDTLRVASEKIDRLVNLVGELVILRSQVTAACDTLGQVPPALQNASEGLLRLSTELRDVVLQVRMMPIGETFNKFKRLVRDLSRDLGKEVELVTEGAETELDKTMLDQLNDPLVHLVRNSLDHGLEPTDERLAAGKPRRGTLRLSAEQRGDRVWIVVSDDGRGLNAQKIRAKAIERGLLPATATPSTQEIYQLIFLPGFSTADTVSQLSGRGVGMDVVKRRIELLRGSIDLQSAPGRGTEIRLSLPLTLAIIEGLMVSVDGDRYIMPLSIARETIELTRAQRQRANGRNVVELRGELVPYLRLRDLFGFTGPDPELERVVIVELEDRHLGIVVDEVLGNHQTVLKSLGWLTRHIQVFSGATVLGDGHVALILDVPNLLTYAGRQKTAGVGLEI
jgi:two-component system chemotaxis sensor kinase CheA